MKGEPLVIERVYNAPADRVWQAITDNAQMKQWYFDIDAFKAEPGFRFSFIGENEGRRYVHLCEVTEVVPGKKLAYSWTYQDYPGHSLVSFELFPQGNKTRVVLTHTGLETFPADNPDFKRTNFMEGWTHIIGTGLKTFVEKEGAPA